MMLKTESVAMALLSALLVIGAGSPDACAGAVVGGCLPGGNGYLRARIRGALNLDIDWRNAELECEGSERPGGHGVRMSFAGPLRSDGRRLRLVFGIGAVGEGGSAHALPTNVTVIFEGEQRLYSTRGDDKCTIDALQQERFGDLSGARRNYRAVARGFCVSPASALGSDERIMLSSFDFAGRLTFDEPRAAPERQASSTSARAQGMTR